MPFPAANIDAVRLSGGGLVVCHDDGTQASYEPLGPGVGVEVEIRVIVRCGACGRPVGDVREWDHEPTGDHVVAFYGKAVQRRASGRTQHSATYALLQPSHGTQPVTACPEHGPVAVTRELLDEHLADSRRRQAGAAAGYPKGNVTRRVKVDPIDAEWIPDHN